MIYRVGYYHQSEGGCGAYFFSTKREAEHQGVLMRRQWREVKKEADEDPDNEGDYSEPDFEVDITEIEVPKNKKEVLLLLNQWAGHADNGHPLGHWDMTPLF